MHISFDVFFLGGGGGSQELISILLHNLAHRSTRHKHAADLDPAQKTSIRPRNDCFKVDDKWQTPKLEQSREEDYRAKSPKRHPFLFSWHSAKRPSGLLPASCVLACPKRFDKGLAIRREWNPERWGKHINLVKLNADPHLLPTPHPSLFSPFPTQIMCSAHSEKSANFSPGLALAYRGS